MTRDYSRFFPNLSTNTGSEPRSVLDTLGWQPFFAQQISSEEIEGTPPVRVTKVHRSGLHVQGAEGEFVLPPRSDATVGDWIMYNEALPNSSRVLARKSLYQRRAPGTDRQMQLIAANIDTAFIVTSCNQDFNIARLERYIALALEAEVTPVIVLTKADLSDDAGHYVETAETISDRVAVVVLDARGDEPEAKLAPWCKPKQTLAFLGSSGVGKSTLVNTLAGTDVTTQGIREDDSKGRHTTTHRQLHLLKNGCTVLDTPGMRELQITGATSGVSELFEDLTELATQCKFSDCKHESEPGCRVLAAVARGEVDASRLQRWTKLVAEDRFHSASLQERKSKDKSLGKLVRAEQKRKRNRK